MITWQDFVLDDVVGPILADVEVEVCRKARLGHPNVMEDVTGNIQETGQEKRPARMVGLSGSDFALTGKEASRNNPSARMRPRGGA